MTDSILRSYQYYSTTSMVPFPISVVDPPLDLYPAACIALSFRRLSTAYAGSAVRIRRSSDNAETDIGFSGNDFDSAAAAAHIGGGTGFIVKWYDQSGNGYDLSQATAGLQPTYTASGIGSKPSMTTTSATGMFLATGTNAVNLSSASLSTAAVALMTSSTDNNGTLIRIKDASNNDFTTPSANVITRSGTTQAIIAYSSGALGSANITYSVAKRMANIFSGSQNTMYVNGSAGTPVSFSSTLGSGAGSVTIRLFQSFGGGAEAWDGQAGELIEWASNQTANLSTIDANQSTYWGV